MNDMFGLSYDDLFAPGNLVVLKNNKKDLLWYHQCLTEEQMALLDQDEAIYIDFKKQYSNPNLDSFGHIFTVEYVYRPTSDYGFEKIFDRSIVLPTSKPELKTGTFVRVAEYDGDEFDEEDLSVGVIVDNCVVYREGGFDYLEDLEPLCDEPKRYNFYIVAVYDEYTKSFAGCTKEHVAWHMKGYRHG